MRFAALRRRYYPGYLTGSFLTMGGDHLEHALSYWAMWQLFHSPLLAGLAVLSHWVPHLLFSVLWGSFADRFDCRRMVQAALVLFMLASLGWAIGLATGTLQPWMCVVLLSMHGLASSLWHPGEQLLVYDIVGPEDLPSAIRLLATAMNLGMLIGPVIGAVLLFTVGPEIGLFLNVLLYVPFMVFLFVVPVTGHVRAGGRLERLSWAEVFAAARDLRRYPVIIAVLVLQTAIGLLIGSAVLPLLPEFGELLDQDESGIGYGLLLAATATGAVIGGLLLETVGRIPPTLKVAIAATVVYALSMLVFAISRSLPITLVALVVSGFATIVSGSTSQTLVQLSAPPLQRGRIMGLYSMTSLGSRAGSGLTIGLLASVLGPAAAVGIDAAALAVVGAALFVIVIVAARRWPELIRRPGERAAQGDPVEESTAS